MIFFCIVYSGTSCLLCHWLY
uniref:Uncharacterized protein n=1 Tax=Anguilla anguilla TaxID=7936 RepID=A0A0E9PR45_ANGAN